MVKGGDMKKPNKNFSIINIDKPSGPTSFTVSDFVRHKLGLKKTSHFGTLDPKVTGVLPVALGRACRLTGFFLGHDKTYIGILHTHKKQEMREVQEIINKNFVGKIKQLPPIRSRVKRAIREREVKKWELLEAGEDGRNFVFIAKVEGGTYIRKLCSDLGEKIGGAHMLELRRIKAGIFSEENSVNLYDFEKAVDENKLGEISIPAEGAIKKIMPVVQVKKGALKELLTGKPLFKKDVVGNLAKEDVFAVFCGGVFVEIARKFKQKDIVGKPLFVFN